MRCWEQFLKLKGWRSEYTSVDKALHHYTKRIKSEKTRANFSSILMQFCKFANKNPEGLVDLTVEEASRLCQNFTDSLQNKNYSTCYVNVTQAYLKTFFKENGFQGAKALKSEHYYQPARCRKKPEYIPTPEEVYKMGYASGNSKNRAMIFTAYTAGLRNSTIRAIRYGDVREELNTNSKNVKIEVYPEMKQVNPQACKGNIPYYTFIDSDSVKALREYLEDRNAIFGGIDYDEPLFCSNSNRLQTETQRKTPVSSNGLERMVKNAAKRAGIKRWRDVTPHCLRKTYKSALRNSVLDGKDQEFLMGHVLPGSQDPYYDKTKIEEMRTKYSCVVFFPDRTQSAIDLEKAKIESLLAFAKLQGLSEEKINSIREELTKNEAPTADTVIKMLSGAANLRGSFSIRKPTEENKTTTPSKNNGKPYQSKIVNEKELVSHMEDGWEIIRELANGNCLLIKPNHIAHVVNQEKWRHMWTYEI